MLYGVANLPDIYVGTTSSTLSAISRTCMPASIGERIGMILMYVDARDLFQDDFAISNLRGA